jgi:hypothetical protein
MTNRVFWAVTSMSALFLSTGLGAARDDDRADAHSLRELIREQIGGLDKLKVPRYQTTETKVHLGELLFHDPVRTARIDPAYGGVLTAKQTASCGSGHLGEAAGKAGAVLNFKVGGEGEITPTSTAARYRQSELHA